MEMQKNRPSFKSSAQVRSLPMMSVSADHQEENEYRATGYAARFEPYVLYEDEDGPVYERFERTAFDNADMSDIIMQYDHEGRVLARLSNGSLRVRVDDNGLYMEADLSRTDAARQMYEDIRTEMVTKMSWRFALGEFKYIPEERTIVHYSVKKVYDVSAVSIPANNNTEINARAWADGVIDLASRSEEELDNIRRRKLRLKIQIQEVINQ